MIGARFKPYPETKESGIEWLGKIPERWMACRLKTVLAQPVTDGPHETPDFLPDGVPFLSVDGIQDGELVFEGCRHIDLKAHEQYRRKCAPRRDDILVGKAASTGKIARVKVDIEFSIWSPLAVVRPRADECVPGYLEYALKSTGTQAQIDILCTSNTQKNISMADIPRITFALPRVVEQEAIAKFLDHETAKIDALVGKKERLIELLQEKRTALISHAVTKGLDPNVPMRDSGIEWLGQIPAHWEITRGRFLGMLLANSVISENDLVEDEEGTPYAKVDDLNYVDSSLVLGATKARVRNVSTRHKTILLFPKRGAAIFTNKVVIADGAYLFDSNLMGWEIGRGADAKYVACCLIARRLDDLADVSSIPQINNKHINPAQFPLPSLPEQSAIVDFLDRETAKIDALIAKIQEAINRLKEYRTALISAAVTGKIDVRNE